MPVCYILFSDSINKYYVGACINLERRLYEHNIGHSNFTSKGISWIIVFSKEFPSLPEAKQFERYIKKQKSRKYIEKLIADAKSSG